MNLIESSTITEALNRTKPVAGLQKVSVMQFNTFFWSFQNADVWTDAGWLITAISGNNCDGFILHMRKGLDRCTMQADGAEILEYVPNARTREIANYFQA